MANLSNIITPTNVLTETSTNTVTNKTINIANNTLTGVQPTLVSGTSIKTVNGTSLLGSGNVDAGGGGEYEAVASGAIASAGLVVSLNSNGTVSTTTGNNASVTSPTVIGTFPTIYFVAAYDPVNKKVVIIYQDGSTSRPIAVVGTVTGSSISFGTTTTVEFSSSNYYAIVFDPVNSKFVFFFQNGSSGVGVAYVGTVSGTTISFGAQSVFTTNLAVNISAGYSTVNSKILLTYQDSSTATATGIVGTVSGTTISFGAAVTNPTGSARKTTTSYHAAQGRFVVAVIRNVAGQPAWASVATISGTSVSFGTAVQFSAATGDLGLTSVYDPVNQNVILAYDDNGTSTVARCAIVSGTVITYGTALTVSTGLGRDQALTWDSNVNRAVLAYKDTNNFGIVNTLRISGTSISTSENLIFQSVSINTPTPLYLAEALKPVIFYGLTSTNRINSVFYTPFFTTSSSRIGIAQSSAANAGTVKVKVLGGVDANQSGLTIGSVYYVAANGALTTTVSAASPRIGLALKANTLLITDSI